MINPVYAADVLNRLPIESCEEAWQEANPDKLMQVLERHSVHSLCMGPRDVNPSHTRKAVGVDRACLLRMVRDAVALTPPERLAEFERALEAVAVMLIEKCADVVECMQLCDETDAVAEAYNIGIADGTEALRMAAAMLRAVRT